MPESPSSSHTDPIVKEIRSLNSSSPADDLGGEKALQRILELYDKVPSVEFLLNELYDVLPPLLGVDRINVVLYDDKLGALVSGKLIDVDHPTENSPSAPQPIGYSVSGICFDQCRTVLVNDCSKTDLIAPEWVEHLGLKSVVAVPLCVTGRPVGVLRIDDCHCTHRFTDEDLNFYQIIGRLVGLIIEHSHLVTEAETTLRRVLSTEERLSGAARNGLNDGTWEWNLQTDHIIFSPRWKSALGFNEADIGCSPSEWFDRVHTDDKERLRYDLANHLDGNTPYFINEHRILHKDGTFRWMVARATATRDEKTQLSISMSGTQIDMTTRKKTEQQIDRTALHDPLTRLPNRALFNDHLLRCMAYTGRRPGFIFALMMLDLDRFKVVNDSLGHATGDALLEAVARRIETCLRPGDTLARFGGDELIILLEDIHGQAEADRIANLIHNVLKLPFSLNGREVFTSVSIGIILSNNSQQKAEDLIRFVDIAMYRAKAQGKARHVFYNPDIHYSNSDTLTLENDLRRALDRNEIVIHYQPIVDLRDGKLWGFEALARWSHPKLGLLPPVRFIPLAEEMGVIVPIGQMILREACHQLRAWQRLLPEEANDLRMCVNLSARQFMEPDIVEMVQRVLMEMGIEPRLLNLEITESLLMEHPDGVIHTLKRLKEVGVELNVDDFGTGFSSLNYLQQFPIDRLKIDKTFINPESPDSNSWEIVSAIIQMAHGLGKSVIAEGVANHDQVQKLVGQSCHLGQSYFFSFPMEATEVTRLLPMGTFSA